MKTVVIPFVPVNLAAVLRLEEIGEGDQELQIDINDTSHYG